MSAMNWLACLLWVPALGVLGIVAAGRRPNLRESVTVVTALTLFLAVIQLAASGEAPRWVLAEPLPGLELALSPEPLGLLFALIASGLWIVTSIYAFGYMRAKHESHQTRFYACFAISIGAAMGIAMSANLLTLFVFYEALTLSTYPLVAHHGDDKARAGARTYLRILLGTSIGLFLPAIIWTHQLAGGGEFQPGGILAGRADAMTAGLLLALYVLGVGKAAVMPVHRWLPAAMVAPTPVSALLHAVAVVKAGVFVILKLVVYVFGMDFLTGVPLERGLLWLAGFTILAASVVALRQDNLKRMLAYSTVGQLSYVVMAALTLGATAGLAAALHIAAHAVAKITLFFTAGAIYVASGKTQVSQLDGIGRRMPVTMTAFSVAALSMIGLPPTVGFVSKWMILQGALEADQLFVVAVLVTSTALNAAYFMPIVHRAFFREEQAVPKEHGEAPLPMVTALAVTALLTLLGALAADGLVAMQSPVMTSGRVE